jgi:hypothetical protein
VGKLLTNAGLSFCDDRASPAYSVERASAIPNVVNVGLADSIAVPGFEVPRAVNLGPGRPVYLDMQATTPMDPRVLDRMMPYYTALYGNPHSRTHAYGWETEKAVEDARQAVADLIGADKKEIIFTSGATESNNIAIKGVARFYKNKKNHIITTQTVGISLFISGDCERR